MKKDWTTGLKDKMSDYSERPSDRVWSNIAGQTGIEAPVREKRERLLPVWLWTSAASAAAIMAGIFILLRHIQPEMQYISAMKIEEVAPVPVNTRNTDEIVSTGNADESDIIVVNADMADKRNDAMMTATANPLHKTSRSNAAEVRQHSAMAAFANKDEGNRLAVAENADFGRSTVEENTEKVSTEAENATYEAESAAYDTGNADHEAAPAEEELEADRKAWAKIIAEDEIQGKGRHGKTNSRQHVSIAMSAAGSGKKNGTESRSTALVLGSNPMSNGETVNSWIDPELIKHTGALTFNQAEVKTEYDHKIPVRMGLSARYGFGRFGIETGLTYSILSSDITTGKKGTTYSKGSQSLHYLGIPINMSFNIVDTRWFTMYAIAGGMGEKSVKGRLKTNEYENGNYVRSTNSSVNPKALQWSVNGALGFQVNIFEQLGFYMEPGVSHRFANNSKIRSSYTDKPTDFSLGFGMRYNFK